MFYRVCIYIVRFILLFMFRVRTIGRENVPSQGAVIFAYNHKSDFDPVIAGVTCPRQLTFMAKSELFKNKIFGALISKLGAFPVHRGKGDVGAMKAAFKILGDERAMLIFPEGGRVKKEHERRAKSGVALIAQRCAVPVVPVHIAGEYKWMHKINVYYGVPMYFPSKDGERPSQDDLQSFADTVLDAIYLLS